jgi:hypothetical protein
MSFVMIKPSQLSPFAFSFDTASRPAGILAVAGGMQQYVQHHPNLWNSQCWGMFFSPDEFPESKTIMK